MNSTEKLKSLLNTLFVLLTIFTPKKTHKNLSKLFGKMEDQIQILISENFLLKKDSDKWIEEIKFLTRSKERHKKHNLILKRKISEFEETNYELTKKICELKRYEAEQIQLIAEQKELIKTLNIEIADTILDRQKYREENYSLRKELKKQNHIETQTDFKAFTMVFNLLINADYYAIGYYDNEYFISNKYGKQYFKNLNQVITHLKSQNKIQKG